MQKQVLPGEVETPSMGFGADRRGNFLVKFNGDIGDRAKAGASLLADPCAPGGLEEARQRTQLEVPLMPELEAHLLSLPSSDDPATKLCSTLASKSTGGNRGLSSTFQRVMAAAGIHSDRGVEKKGKRRQFKILGFHSLQRGCERLFEAR